MSEPEKTCDTCGKSKRLTQFPTYRFPERRKGDTCQSCLYARRVEHKGLIAPPQSPQQQGARKAAKTRKLNRATTAAEHHRIDHRWEIERGRGPHQTGEPKHCPRCDQTLPATAFGLDLSRRSGLAVRCRKCRSSRSDKK